jgi:hypothetical protein
MYRDFRNTQTRWLFAIVVQQTSSNGYSHVGHKVLWHVRIERQVLWHAQNIWCCYHKLRDASLFIARLSHTTFNFESELCFGPDVFNSVNAERTIGFKLIRVPE